MLRILQNAENRNHGQVLENWLAGSSDAFIAVAFLKSAGWRMIAGGVQAFLERGGRLRLVVGTDFYMTEPEPLRELLRLRAKYPALEWRLVASSGSSTFHPKYYRFQAGKWIWLLTGSANLTAGGLSRNIETSVMVEDAADGPLGKECEKTEAQLWVLPRNQVPDEGIVGRYAAAYSAAKDSAALAQRHLAEALEKQSKLEGQRLEEELALYRSDAGQQAELETRRANYIEALRLVRRLLAQSDSTPQEFAAVYEKLVGERKGTKLWHSGSVYRSKSKVLSQWQDVLAMLREIEAARGRSPEEMYALGEKWMKQIHGIGPNIFTEFCHTLDPKRFTPLNNNPVTSLRWLGVDDFPRPSAFKPEDYGRFCRCMDRLRARGSFADLGDADHFLNFVYWRHRDEADALTPLSDFPFDEVKSEYGGEIAAQVKSLLSVLNRICPDCLCQQRDDGAWIFVPAVRAGAKRDKNLLTLWPSAHQLRLRILPAEEERFETARLPDYENRLAKLHLTLSAI